MRSRTIARLLLATYTGLLGTNEASAIISHRRDDATEREGERENFPTQSFAPPTGAAGATGAAAPGQTFQRDPKA